MLDDRFWTKVKVSTPDECWEWTANKNNKGYGLFRPGGSRPKCLAHRLSYEEKNGAIPKGSIIRHSCDNPACVNPAHLRAGSQYENMIDKVARLRHGFETMAPSAVIALLKDYVSGVSRKELSRKYGVPLSSLSDYTGGKSWSHLHGQHGCPTYEELQSAKRRKPGSLLTPDDVRAIRLRLTSGETCAAIAHSYGMKRASIRDIKHRRNWADVD